jgi:hypothetical protein
MGDMCAPDLKTFQKLSFTARPGGNPKHSPFGCNIGILLYTESFYVYRKAVVPKMLESYFKAPIVLFSKKNIYHVYSVYQVVGIQIAQMKSTPHVQVDANSGCTINWFRLENVKTACLTCSLLY